jgi:hypothetical protein
MMLVLSVLGWVLMFGGTFGLGVWFVRVRDDLANDEHDLRFKLSTA